jgi:hypothetical protein
MKIPDGYTEQEVIDIIDSISCKLSGKFKFGYYELEDIKQEAALFAWQGLENYDGVRPLENFLWIHIRNRLYNLKRNNYCRPEKPCDNCPYNAYIKKNDECSKYSSMKECSIYLKWFKRNQTKKNLMSTKSSDLPILEDKKHINDEIFSKEIYNIVDSSIPISLREDWIRFVNKINISKNKRKILMKHIYQILKDKGIDI